MNSYIKRIFIIILFFLPIPASANDSLNTSELLAIIDRFILDEQPLIDFVITTEQQRVIERHQYIPYLSAEEFLDFNPNCCHVSRSGIEGYTRKDGGDILVIRHSLRFQAESGEIVTFPGRAVQVFVD